MNRVKEEKVRKDEARDAGYKKAAKFLMLIGKEEAARVLKHLSASEVEGIAFEIARLDRVDEREAAKILEEFGCLAKSKELVARGGLEQAKKMLLVAFGPEKGEAAFNKLRIKTAFQPFAFLADLDFAQVLMLLKNESIPVMSLILTHLEPDLAARILKSMPADTQRQVVKRIVRMTKITPETVQQAEDSLKEKIRAMGEIVTQEIDGETALADILGYLDLNSEEKLIEELSNVDPELAETMRQRLFNISVILRIPDRDFETILRDFEDREVALVMKGKDEPIKQKFLQNVSTRRQGLIKIEYDDLGFVTKTDSDKATGEFLDYLRTRVERGDVVLIDREEEFID
jgi:flagellar motor switch protein FliG